MNRTTFLARGFVRWPALVVAGLMTSFAGALSTADAQDGYRDRGDRYARATAENSGRSRTRFDNNSRFESTPSSNMVRSRNSPQGNNYRPAYNDSYRQNNYNDSYRHNSYNNSYRHNNYNNYGNNYRYVKPYYKPSNSLSLSYNTYSNPSYHHARYNYAPAYRSYKSHNYYRGPYFYRPAYEPYPVYQPYYVPVTHVSAYYGYRPYGYYCPPYASYGHYSYYGYPRSTVSFGLRFDYRW